MIECKRSLWEDAILEEMRQIVARLNVGSKISGPMESIGKLIIGAGIALVGVGLFVWLFADKLSWLGSLPGDIKVERPEFSLYIPITTMLLISASLSFVLWLIGLVSRFAR